MLDGPIDFDIHSDRDLLALKEEVMTRTTFILQENKLFQSYLLRVNPNALRDPATESTAEAPTAVAGVGGIGGRKRQKDLKKDAEGSKPVMLTAEQKSEIATRELEELRDEIEKRKDEWAKVLDNLKAEMEEVDIRSSEVKKAMFEFKRDIIGQAVNARTGKVVAERVMRYYEDKIRAKVSANRINLCKDTIIEKVRLKNATLKVQKNKLHLQLKQKEEMGEVLHVIDFDQLQIENKQYQTRIEERNGELLKLKKSAGNTVQILNYYKKKLASLTRESIKLVNEINSRKDLLNRLVTEAKSVSAERAQAQEYNASLKGEIGDFRVPHVMDYVEVKVWAVCN